MTINRNIFQRMQGIILMYDIKDKDSFAHLSRWIDLINKNVSNTSFMILGNKLDLSTEKRLSQKKKEKKLQLIIILNFLREVVQGKMLIKFLLLLQIKSVNI